jgi:L-arginine dehydrogenase
MDVYCDYRHTTPQHAAEMCLARQHHGWTDDAIKGDLPELVVRRCKNPTTNGMYFSVHLD